MPPDRHGQVWIRVSRACASAVAMPLRQLHARGAAMMLDGRGLHLGGADHDLAICFRFRARLGVAAAIGFRLNGTGANSAGGRKPLRRQHGLGKVEARKLVALYSSASAALPARKVRHK